MNYSNFFKHIEKLQQSIYNEPWSPHHAAAARDAVIEFLKPLDFESVVELGCGTAPCLDAVLELGNKRTLGVTIGHENNKHEIIRDDMHFTDLPDNSFDIVIVRHALEHSPIPLILLMEMARISKRWALVIVPTPTEPMIEYQNHYSVFDSKVWEQLFKIAGWKVLKFKEINYFFRPDKTWDAEYRYLLEKT